MKEFKGTPGPWEANERIGISAAITHANPAGIGVPAPTIARVIIRYSALEQGQANLKLIAAAPELLDCLMKVTEYLDNVAVYEDAQPVINSAQAAINKALGE